MENKNLKIAVAVLALLLAGAVGYIVGHSTSTPSSEAVQDEAAAAVAEEAAQPQAQTQEEKTYGYYPSFYVKKLYYTVDAAERDYSIRIYTDSKTELKKARTNCKWLEEDDLEDGGKTFHVKKNKDSEKRKGELYLVDNKDRKITIYVTQKGK